MKNTDQHAVYRLTSFRRREDMRKNYRESYELSDDSSGQVMARCDLIGQAVFATLEIRDVRDACWTLRPNRKFMPSRWMLSDPDGLPAISFDQKIVGKLMNPLYRVALAILDAEGHELYKLVDPRQNIADRIMSACVGEWVLLADDRPVAKLVSLPRLQQQSYKGLLGRLKKLISLSDQGIVSAGNQHLLEAPVALAMLLLFKEVTDTSGE